MQKPRNSGFCKICVKIKKQREDDRAFSLERFFFLKFEFFFCQDFARKGSQLDHPFRKIRYTVFRT